MTYRISYDTFGEHRNTTFLATVTITDDTGYALSHYITDVNIIVALLVDQQWWIIPNNPSEEAQFTDVGPFDDAETAIVHLKLLVDKTI